jgi:hypothetical protein
MRPLFRSFIKTALGGLALITAAPITGTADVGSVVISIPEQRMYLFDEAGEKISAYRVSTSQYGTGNSRGSYTTPLGNLAVAAKVGAGAPVGTVFKGCNSTGEICKVNAKGRDPIVTRIIHLRGLEKENAGAYGRRIYIHGTPDERHIGQAVSYGCIRMRSSDVIAVFDAIGVGTRVEITDQRVSAGMFAKTTRPPAPIAASPEKDSHQAKVDATPKLIASAKVPRVSATPVSISSKPPKTPSAPAEKKSGGAFSRMLESSGLTISFGGGEEADRPK